MRHYYPILLLSSDMPCLVVGGGEVAERKILALLESGATVTVVAPTVTQAIEDLATAGKIAIVRREAQPVDLDGVRLVILATDDRAANEALAAEAERRGLLLNVVDVPDLCNFYVPATVDRGPITVAISTGGASPALAKRLRKMIEGVVGEEHGLLAALMGELRPSVMERWPTQRERAAAWEALLQSEVLPLLKDGRIADARRLARHILGLSETAIT